MAFPLLLACSLRGLGGPVTLTDWQYSVILMVKMAASSQLLNS